MTINAQIPAATSSRTIPVPSGSLSNCRTGGGFTISNARKSIKPARKVFHASGTAMSAINCPATSSITTICGSFLPDACETRVAAGIPTAMTTTAKASAATVRRFGGSQWHTAPQSTTVAADPHVPGPGFSRPIPKKVAIAVAQSGAALWDKSAEFERDEAIAGCAPELRSESAAWLTACPRALPECFREFLPLHP